MRSSSSSPAEADDKGGIRPRGHSINVQFSPYIKVVERRVERSFHKKKHIHDNVTVSPAIFGRSGCVTCQNRWRIKCLQQQQQQHEDDPGPLPAMVQRHRPGFSGRGRLRHFCSLHRQALFKHGSESAAVMTAVAVAAVAAGGPNIIRTKRNVNIEPKLADSFGGITSLKLACLHLRSVSVRMRTNQSLPGWV
ncbi:hypothetical protein LY78DRAFT_286226 [Colletotrichum sublineola]|nr:hypothetical protein LY78DRAFT_286226 [Colletotrichum sublineola]